MVDSDLAQDRSARVEVARACRLLAVAGVLDGVLGHVSLRRGRAGFLVRCRGPQERGLRFTHADDIQFVCLETGPRVAPGYVAPNELPIHTAILAARDEVQAVVHAHPPFALLAGLAGLELPPMFGAYNIPASRLAEAGIAVYPRAALINDDLLAVELVAAMGDAQACLLQGHGIVAVGATLEEAVLTAHNLEALARVAVELRRLGVSPRPISDRDLQQLPDLGRGFNDGHSYRHLAARLEAEDHLLGIDVGLR